MSTTSVMVAIRETVPVGKKDGGCCLGSQFMTAVEANKPLYKRETRRCTAISRFHTHLTHSGVALMLAWCLVSTALLAATTFAQAGARSDGRRHGSGLVAAPRDPSETAHRSRLDDRYQIGGFTLQEWTSPDGRVWTVKHPDETTLPLLQTPPDGTSPRDPDIFCACASSCHR